MKRKKIGAVPQADIDRYSVQIYNQARKGTPAGNPGVPMFLANLIVAQARHETGDFSSNAFTRYNNAFGYSYVPGARYQVGPGLVADNGQPVAAYANLNDSVNEIVDWIYRRKKEGKFPADLSTIKTPEQYATLLKAAGYYGDSLENYWQGIARFFKQILPGAAGGAAVVVLVAVGLFVFRRQLFPGVHF